MSVLYVKLAGVVAVEITGGPEIVFKAGRKVCKPLCVSLLVYFVYRTPKYLYHNFMNRIHSL